MINNPTIDKLIGMRLTAMAEAYLQQLSDPNMKEIDFEDRIGMMVDIVNISVQEYHFVGETEPPSRLN